MKKPIVDLGESIEEDRAVLALPERLREYMPGLAIFRRRPCTVRVPIRFAPDRPWRLEECGEPLSHENPQDGSWTCTQHALPGAVDHVPPGWTGPSGCFAEGTRRPERRRPPEIQAPVIWRMDGNRELGLDPAGKTVLSLELRPPLWGFGFCVSVFHDDGTVVEQRDVADAKNGQAVLRARAGGV